MERLLEVCCGDILSVMAAIEGGADRIELCSALELGGLTPSAGLIVNALSLCAEKGVKVHVLIRPRPGDFVYTIDEIDVMADDILFCKDMGVDGVVIGPLDSDGRIEAMAMRQLMQAAEGMSVTFHRAIDVCADWKETLEEIISFGCDTILTSGQAETAQKGIPTIQEMVEMSDGRIGIMPGCGVNQDNAAEILNKTGAIQIHASAKKEIKRDRVSSGVRMGSEDHSDSIHWVTDTKMVRMIKTRICK